MFAQERSATIGETGNVVEFSLESPSLLTILDSLSLWDSLSRIDHPLKVANNQITARNAKFLFVFRSAYDWP